MHKAKSFWNPELNEINREKRAAYIDSKKYPDNPQHKLKFGRLKRRAQKMFRHSFYNKENKFVKSLNKAFKYDIIKYYKMLKYKLRPKKEVNLSIDKIYDIKLRSSKYSINMKKII
jgi:hypothetical protein